MNSIKKSDSNYQIYFILIAIIGFALRMSMSNFGIDAVGGDRGAWDSDVEAFQTNLNLLRNGLSFYEPGHYNYSPLWLWILHFVDLIRFPFVDNSSYDIFRIKIIIFLSLVDFFIFLLLCKNYSLTIGLLFFLNPISIIVTGIHNQFDNLAVLSGFLSVLYFDKYQKNNFNSGFVISLIILGLSLSVKHILFIFPFWIAIKEKNLIRKILIIIIPFSIFLVSFFPYLLNDLEHILQNVLFYKSYNNGPFWGMFASKVVDMYIERKHMFIILLLLLGIFFEKKSIKDSYYLYLIALVTFSSSVAFQYLTIPVLAIAIYWNRFFLIFTLLAMALSLVTPGEFNFEILKEYLGWNRTAAKIAFYPIILFLLLGFLETVFGKKKLNYIFFKILNWFIYKIKSQFKFNKKKVRR